MAILTHAAKAFLIRECSAIDIAGRVLRINQIDEVVDVLDHFLASPASDARVAGIAPKVAAAIAQAASSSDPHSSSNAVGVLATSFEPFLKKVAILKYRDDPFRLQGDSVYFGLLDMTLGKLLEGQLSQRNKTGPKAPPVLAKLVSFSYSPTTPTEHVYWETRAIRNRVHESPECTLTESIRDLKIVLTSYCLAIEENLPRIRCLVDPLFKYLVRLRDKVDSHVPLYIDTQGAERKSKPSGTLDELLAVEWVDGPVGRSSARIAQGDGTPYTGTIRDIARQKHQLWLVGEPGSGKSTSLEAIAGENADAMLQTGRIDGPIPVLIPATLFSSSYTLIDSVQDTLGVSKDQIETLLLRGQVRLLIDGLNETSESQRATLIRQLRQLLLRHSDLPFIVSTRKNGLDRSLDVQVFEVLPFTDANIHEYVMKALPTKDAAEHLYEALTEPGSRFASFARNPLLLSMICHVAKDGVLPDNRARILKLFTSWLLQRESKAHLDPGFLYEHVLAELAFATRHRAAATLTQEEAVAVIQRALREHATSVSVFHVLQQLVAASLLFLDARRGIGFLHELILEYYAGRSLDSKLSAGQVSLAEIAGRPEWHEAIRIYAGLLEDPEPTLLKLVAADPLLVARCITAGARSSATVEREIVVLARRALGGDAAAISKEQALTALLELGTKHALRVVVHSSIDRGQLFEKALWGCERPEQASANLLRFGFTGRERLHTCIRAFRGHQVSQRFLDSPEVGEAQSRLLCAPVVLRYIQAVGEMGLSSGARGAAENLLRISIHESPGNVSILAACMKLAVNGGLVEGTVSGVRKIFPPDKPFDGQQAYSVLRILCEIGKNPDTADLALAYARRCFADGLVLLGCEFVRRFDQLAAISEADVRDYSRAVLAKGRLGQAMSLRNTFGHIDLSCDVLALVESLLAAGKIDLILQYASDVATLLLGKESLLSRVLITRSCTGGLSPKMLRRCIQLFNLHAQFADVWVVSSYLTERRFGFIRNAVTHESAFFHVSRLEGTTPPISGLSLKGRLISGVVGESPTHTGKLRLRNGRLLTPE